MEQRGLEFGCLEQRLLGVIPPDAKDIEAEISRRGYDAKANHHDEGARHFTIGDA